MRTSTSFIRLVTLTAALCASSAFADGAMAATRAGLAGSWQVAVTLVDCTSGTALAPPFTSLLAFAGDGTESETTNNPAFQPGQRSPGFGAWSIVASNRYHLSTYALILFSTTAGPHPIMAGSQRLTQTITLAGNAWSSSATIQFYDTSGTQVGAGCAMAQATRLT